MRRFGVLHNFDAQDNVELTVKKGETVVPVDGGAVQDGWVKVEVLHDPKRRGFVPLNYLRELAEKEQADEARARSPGTFTSAALDYGDALQNAYGRGGQSAPATGEKLHPVPSPGQSAATERSLLNNPNAVVEAFMKNELHFKQLVRERQDALSQMRATLEDVIVELTGCKEKNVMLARKLRDLDQSVEKERERWKERILEEKAYISRFMSSE